MSNSMKWGFLISAWKSRGNIPGRATTETYKPQTKSPLVTWNIDEIRSNTFSLMNTDTPTIITENLRKAPKIVADLIAQEAQENKDFEEIKVDNT